MTMGASSAVSTRAGTGALPSRPAATWLPLSTPRAVAAGRPGTAVTAGGRKDMPCRAEGDGEVSCHGAGLSGVMHAHHRPSSGSAHGVPPPAPVTHQLGSLEVLAQQNQRLGAVRLHGPSRMQNGCTVTMLSRREGKASSEAPIKAIAFMPAHRTATDSHNPGRRRVQNAHLTAARRGSSVRSSSSMWPTRCALTK